MPSSSSMRTPLGKVRGLGRGAGGTTAFWHERVSGIALLPLTIVFVLVLLSMRGATTAEAFEILANPFVSIVMIATVVVTAWHMKLGMQVIIEDYVHHEPLRLLSLMANSFVSAFVGLAGTFALLKIAFGA
jgi:succinate dehydrogenase / fumarate reductase membrane anchor subunit